MVRNTHELALHPYSHIIGRIAWLQHTVRPNHSACESCFSRWQHLSQILRRSQSHCAATNKTSDPWGKAGGHLEFEPFSPMTAGDARYNRGCSAFESCRSQSATQT